MNNLFYADGGDTDFFNNLVDMGMQQSQDQQTEPDANQTTSADPSDEFIKNLNSYADQEQNTNLQDQIDELKQQLTLNQADREVTSRIDDLEYQINMASYYQTPTGEDEILSKYAAPEPPTDSQPTGGPRYTPNIHQLITDAESKGRGGYQAYTSKGGGSGAIGAFQFRWNIHRDMIKNVTGVTTPQEFLNNPQAQEQAFAYWDKTTLTPTALEIQQKLRAEGKIVPDLDAIKKQVHFAGVQGAKDYYYRGKLTKDAFGTTNKTYGHKYSVAQ